MPVHDLAVPGYRLAPSAPYSITTLTMTRG
jgi:hypothetical protein